MSGDWPTPTPAQAPFPPTADRLFQNACAAFASRPALTGPGGDAIPYHALADSIEQIRDALRSRGIARHHRVGLIAPLRPETAAVSLGLIGAATAVNLPPGMTAPELEELIRRIGLRAIAAPADLSDPARDVASRIGLPWLDCTMSTGGAVTVDGRAAGPAAPDRPATPDDVATIALSSGTTGKPKLIPRSHRNVTGMADRADRALPLPPGNRTTILLPYFHHGWVQAIRSLHTGGTMSLPGEYSRNALPTWLALHRPTWLFLTPPTLTGLLDTLDPDHPAGGALEFIQVAGISLPQATRERAAAHRITVLDCYGSNESGTVALEQPGHPAPAGSVGRAIVAMRIADEQGHPVAPGKAGSVLVPADEVFPGYLDDPALNQRAFTPDGWFRMGDRGTLSSDGFLTILGRDDDVINRGGEKIDPREVETVLSGHPAVAECAVFGIADETAGQEAAAAVALHPNMQATARELRRWMLDHLAPGKTPRRIVIVTQLPRTRSGKLSRSDLASLLVSPDAGGAP